jgi:mevalonate kinase
MPAISATAPGKAILFGEHAVVYNRPAIAVPVTEVSAHAVAVFARDQVMIEAPDIQLFAPLSSLPNEHPLTLLFTAIQNTLNLDHFPAFKLKITSTIPIAAGLGSGASVSVAAARAITAYLGYSLSAGQLSDIAYEVEKYHHGTPSGIDNTVIAYAKPIYFIRNQPIEILNVSSPFTLIIADSGVPSPTRTAVNGVRQRWTASPDPYNTWFDQIAELTHTAHRIITSGDPRDLGPLMLSNHALLQKIGVSIPELDRLVVAAMNNGAWGAKLAGAGAGGNMIALVPPDKVEHISASLVQAGAVRTVVSHIYSSPNKNEA